MSSTRTLDPWRLATCRRRQAAGLLDGTDRVDETIGCYQRAAEGGDHLALERAAGLLKRAGRGMT